MTTGTIKGAEVGFSELNSSFPTLGPRSFFFAATQLLSLVLSAPRSAFLVVCIVYWIEVN